MSSATVTVIDRSKGIEPRAFDRASAGASDPAIRAKLAVLQSAAEGRDAHNILELALKGEFAGKTAVVSSFGSESAVLLHMVAEIDPTTPILFLNTGKLFGETLRYRDRLQDVLGSPISAPSGRILSDRAARIPMARCGRASTDACCDFRKVAPIRRALEGFVGANHGPQAIPDQCAPGHAAGRIFRGPVPLQSTGRLDPGRYRSLHRPNMNLPRPSAGRGRLSLHRLHALHAPCSPGEGYRDGRWSGLDKDECGIHTGIDGEGI